MLAYNPRLSTCALANMSYQFDLTADDWAGDTLDDVANVGLQRLNSPRAQNGNALANLTRQPNIYNPNDRTAVIRVFRQDLGAGSHGGSDPDCVDRYIWITSRTSQANTIEKLAIHEMMHEMGATHGGAGDSWIGANKMEQIPTKSSTCGSLDLYNRYAGLSVDDVALLSFLHDPQPDRQMMADSGFEFGYGVWSTQNITTFQRVQQAGARGNYRQKVQSSSSNPDTHYVQQIVSVLTAGLAPQYRATADAGRQSSSYALGGEIVLLARWKHFGGNPNSNSCGYNSQILDDRQPNDLLTSELPSGVTDPIPPSGGSDTPTYGPWAERITQSRIGVPTGWQPFDTPWWTPGAAMVDQSIELASRFAGVSTSGGTVGYFWLDNLTVEENT